MILTVHQTPFAPTYLRTLQATGKENIASVQKVTKATHSNVSKKLDRTVLVDPTPAASPPVATITSACVTSGIMAMATPADRTLVVRTILTVNTTQNVDSTPRATNTSANVSTVT